MLYLLLALIFIMVASSTVNEEEWFDLEPSVSGNQRSDTVIANKAYRVGR